MASINRVTLIGNVCKGGIKSFQTKTGKSGAFVNLVTSEKVKDEYKSTFHKVVFYSALADVINAHCKEGTTIYVEGRLSYDEENRCQIVAQEFKFISKKDD